MRALYKAPNDMKFHQLNIPNELHPMQELVGGYIETLTVATDCCVICNEESRILGMPENCNLCGIDFAGPVLLVGVDGDEFTDCPMSLMMANGMIR